MTFSGMLQNFNGSAIVTPIEGGGQVVGVSNNVNYDVQSDGAVAFNMANTLGQFRFPHSQTQPEPEAMTLEVEACETEGLPEFDGDNRCQVGDNAQLLATVYDQYGHALPYTDVNFVIDNQGNLGPGVTPDSNLTATTNKSGEARLTFTNTVDVTNNVSASVSGGPNANVSVEWILGPPTEMEVEVFEEDDTNPPDDIGATLGLLGSTNPSGEEWVFLEMTVTDEFGNPYESEDITLAVDPDIDNPSDRRGSFNTTNSGSFDPNDTVVTVQTDSNGVASTWYLQKAGFTSDEAYIVVTGPNDLEVDGVIDFDV